MLFRNNDLINEMKKLNSKFERQIDRGNVYKFMWLNADVLVAKAWADAQKGAAISVPGWQYIVLSSFLRFGPRPLIRKLGMNVRTRQRNK